MEKLVRKLRQDYPAFTFIVGDVLCWSPAEGQIFYRHSDSQKALSGLFHELAHATLGHHGYTSDIDLLQKEVLAWETALELAQDYTVTIDADHMQDCLDTYRDWVHKRSCCPMCSGSGVQPTQLSYTCLNCGHRWRVSASRFCRPYRRSQQKNRASV